jgi:hypothetical protein
MYREPGSIVIARRPSGSVAGSIEYGSARTGAISAAISAASAAAVSTGAGADSEFDGSRIGAAVLRDAVTLFRSRAPAARVAAVSPAVGPAPEGHPRKCASELTKERAARATTIPASSAARPTAEPIARPRSAKTPPLVPVASIVSEETPWAHNSPITVSTTASRSSSSIRRIIVRPRVCCSSGRGTSFPTSIGIASARRTGALSPSAMTRPAEPPKYGTSAARITGRSLPTERALRAHDQDPPNRRRGP